MLSAIFAVSLFSVVLSKDLSNGWNENIAWKTLDDGLFESKQTGKPVMLVIHKSWCGACKSLKPKFAESTEIEELSSNFIMVNTIDDDEPQDAKYKPDGGYIPRILFIDSNGDIDEDLYHRNGNPKYKFYYHAVSGILNTMREAEKKFRNREPAQARTEEL